MMSVTLKPVDPSELFAPPQTPRIVKVTSTALVAELLLTLTTPLSHHDPAKGDDSNRNLFNRQKQFVAKPPRAAWPDEASVKALLEANPVPISIAALFAEISLADFVAIAALKRFIDLYNTMDGVGLFEGMERYNRLEARASQASVGVANLRAWWDKLTDLMAAPTHGGDNDGELLRIITVRSGLAQQSLAALNKHSRTLVSIARHWHTTEKGQSEAYASKSGKEQIDPRKVVLELELDFTLPSASVIDVPSVSANSVRHQLVREPAMYHLLDRLGILQDAPGKGLLPPGLEALLYNGGNIKAGAKQPSNTFSLAMRMRERFPSLDLLGGVADTFDIGESRLKVASWLVCRENAIAFEGSPAIELPTAGISAFDLLDDVTMTRQAGKVGSGQMIFDAEVLQPGTQVLVRFALDVGTPVLTQGAFEAAVGHYMANVPTLGGQAARGFGYVKPTWLQRLPEGAEALQQYEDYLAQNRDQLRSWLADGTLGTGAEVVS